jgi:hypothetical protein
MSDITSSERLRLRGGKKREGVRQLRIAKTSSGRIKRSMAVMTKPNFSILKRGNRYTLRANDVSKGVVAQVRSFLANKTGQAYVDGEKMSKKAAFRYIVSQLQQKTVQVVFRRK